MRYQIQAIGLLSMWTFLFERERKVGGLLLHRRLNLRFTCVDHPASNLLIRIHHTLAHEEVQGKGDVFGI